MQHSNSIRLSIPKTTYQKILHFAEHIDCISETGNPQPSNAVRKACRVILNFHSDEQFQECLQKDGGDTLSFIQKCVRKGMQEVLEEKK